MNRQIRDQILSAIIRGVQRNGDRIFSISQDTASCFVPRDSGMLAHSGVPNKLVNGFEISYNAPYACIYSTHKVKHRVLLATGNYKNIKTLKPGMKVNNGFGEIKTVIAVNKFRFPKENKRIFKLETESGKIIYLSEGHRIPLNDGRLVKVKDLKNGDSVNISYSENLIRKSYYNDYKYEWKFCRVCGKKLRNITHTHLKKHDLTITEYLKLYPETKFFDSNSRKYNSWNKGLTKETDERIKRYSEKRVGFNMDTEAKQKMCANHWSTKRKHSFNYIERIKDKCACDECNNIIEKKPNDKHNRFCCEECEIKWRKIRYSGRDNPRYGKQIEIKYRRSNSGFRKDIDHYVRSSWEANIARLLKYINLSYIYEGKRFELSNGKTYLPDFYIPSLDLYIEVKGYPDDKFKYLGTFVNDYPNIMLKIIDGEVYHNLGNKFGDLIKEWEWKKSSKLKK